MAVGLAPPRPRRVLIKVGGETVRDPLDRARLARDIAQLIAGGAHVAVVHGAGPQITKLGEQLGLKSTFRGGRRVTDAAMLHTVALAMCGEVGPNLLASLLAAGVRALATPAASAGIAVGRKRPPTRLTGEPQAVDYGLVADIAHIGADVVVALWQAGLVPVLSSLVADTQGQLLNLNADTLTTALVAALGIDDVVLVTGVSGVYRDLNDPGSHVPHLLHSEIGPLLQSGAIGGGMVAKLEEVANIITQGAQRVLIVGYRDEAAIAAAVSNQPGTRTVISAGVAP